MPKLVGTTSELTLLAWSTIGVRFLIGQLSAVEGNAEIRRQSPGDDVRGFHAHLVFQIKHFTSKSIMAG